MKPIASGWGRRPLTSVALSYRIRASELAIGQVRIDPQESVRPRIGLGRLLGACLVAAALWAQALMGAAHPSGIFAMADGLDALGAALHRSVILCTHTDDPSAPAGPAAPHAHDCQRCTLCHSLGFAMPPADRHALRPGLAAIVVLPALPDPPAGRRRWLGSIQPRAPPRAA
jgi:hypothetical protein